ncbi:hypothetical protein AMTRI_Chr08g203950 [Amborella trichopoda]|uniref:non-specific serine/threonine protein kinase n=1 Tax=Amborella trichopoda TaxID=13333 RepID=W1PJG2_AMBTC|nr:probable serine/threonine-protein kinase PIX7 [Amborella trichopoda]ERN07884.1 hypothetical protein AMTR_s00012p00223410 [Amborella trichopoda]|eukprot:XP_011624107.2 probable serine/threonine-protein kinase PIX7 [Amborella trichopoda]
MKCFHFSPGEKKEGDRTSTSRVSWIHSNNGEARRSEFDTNSADFSDSDSGFCSLSQRPNNLYVFKFSELKAATRGFSRALMIGEGGFGCVYRGVIDVPDVPSTKIDVAVKKLDKSGFQGHKEWVTEVNFLGVVSHPNLVKLVGYCAEDDERGIQRLLVYEYMPNNSLEDHLLCQPSTPIPWPRRLKIAQDAARGLAYLHEELDFQIIFRDLKTSNILLDKDFRAKLSDFGLARQGPPEGAGHVSTVVVGTVGYAAPEYIHTGRLTAKSDVWSFGVVLYELITGRRSMDRNRPKSEQKLLEWVKPYLSDPKKFHNILDPRLDGQCDVKSAQKLTALASKCLIRNPKSRPKMSEVVEILDQIIEIAEGSADQAVFKETSSAETNVGEATDQERETGKGRVTEFIDVVNARIKQSRLLDWRGWGPGLVRTW